MTEKDSNEAEVREVLLDAIEIELAALNAFAGFWKEWIDHTSIYTETAGERLREIRSRQELNANQLLLEFVDMSRESMRVMTELPRNAAVRFLHELERLEKDRGRRAGPRRDAGKKAAATKTAKSGSRRPRRRVKAKP